MKKTFYAVLIITITVIAACQPRTQPGSDTAQTPHKVFFDRFKPLEGQCFRGTQTFLAEGMASWDSLELEMCVRVVSDTAVLIPFRVGDNTSRTWMILLEGGDRLRFRHDHRHTDGTPEDLTLYGGYATPDGTEFRQSFPADEYTCKLLSRICDNRWEAEFGEGGQTFSYSLYKADDLKITIRFDLKNPMQNSSL